MEEAPSPMEAAKFTSVFEHRIKYNEKEYTIKFYSSYEDMEVIINKEDKPTKVDVTHIASVSEQQAVEFAREAIESYKQSLTVTVLNLGMKDSYFYMVNDCFYKDMVCLESKFS